MGKQSQPKNTKRSTFLRRQIAQITTSLLSSVPVRPASGKPGDYEDISRGYCIDSRAQDVMQDIDLVTSDTSGIFCALERRQADGARLVDLGSSKEVEQLAPLLLIAAATPK